MGQNDDEVLNSSMLSEFRRVMLEDMKNKKMSKQAYGKAMRYLAQPGFNRIINGKSVPSIRAVVDISENILGYEWRLVKKEDGSQDQNEPAQ